MSIPESNILVPGIVPYTREGERGFLRATKGEFRRYAIIRLVGGAEVSHSRVGGIGDVRAGASLAVRRGL
jgi:hypothetical protein